MKQLLIFALVLSFTSQSFAQVYIVPGKSDKPLVKRAFHATELNPAESVIEKVARSYKDSKSAAELKSLIGQFEKELTKTQTAFDEKPTPELAGKIKDLNRKLMILGRAHYLKSSVERAVKIKEQNEFRADERNKIYTTKDGRHYIKGSTTVGGAGRLFLLSAATTVALTTATAGKVLGKESVEVAVQKSRVISTAGK